MNSFEFDDACRSWNSLVGILGRHAQQETLSIGEIELVCAELQRKLIPIGQRLKSDGRDADARRLLDMPEMLSNGLADILRAQTGLEACRSVGGGVDLTNTFLGNPALSASIAILLASVIELYRRFLAIGLGLSLDGLDEAQP